jgi:hypothetical protein
LRPSRIDALHGAHCFGGLDLAGNDLIGEVRPLSFQARHPLGRAAVGAGSLGDGGGGLVFLLGLVVASSVATSCGGTGGKRSVLRSATPG